MTSTGKFIAVMAVSLFATVCEFTWASPTGVTQVDDVCNSVEWTLPCGVSVVGAPVFGEPSIVMVLRNITVFLDRARNDTYEFQRQFQRKGMTSSTLCEADTPLLLDGFPDLNDTWSSVVSDPFKVSGQLADDFVKLATSLAFISEIMGDDLALVKPIRYTLCYFERYIDQPMSYPDCKVVPLKYRNEMNPDVHQKQRFALTKGISILLNSLFEKYLTLVDFHKVIGQYSMTTESSTDSKC